MDGKASIRIGRVSGSKEYIAISIEDEQSNIQVVELEMSFEDFAKCLTGMSTYEVPAHYGDLSKIGKKFEVKTVIVSGLSSSTWKKKDKLIKPFEVDGWSAREEEEFNHHHISKNGYQVTFRRWV